jgi:hypothetical protein
MRWLYNFIFITSSGLQTNAQNMETLAAINYAMYFDSVPNTFCLVRPSADEIIYCGYTDVMHYSKYGMVLKKHDSLYWLDLSGNELGKYKASLVVPLTDKLVCIKRSFQFEIYNRKESKYSKKIDADSLIFSSENYLIIKKDSQYAVLDIDLNIVLPFQNRRLNAILLDKIFYENSLAKQGIINLKGEEFIPDEFDGFLLLDSSFVLGYKEFDSRVNKDHLINLKTGQTIAIYDEIIVRRNSMFRLGDVFNTFYSEIGVIIPSKFIYESNKYFIVKSGKKFGVIDNYGKILIPIEYESIEQYGKDLLVLKIGKKSGIYNLREKLPIELKYEYIETYSPLYLICKLSDKDFDMINLDKNIKISHKYQFRAEPLDSNYIHGFSHRTRDFLYNVHTKEYVFLNSNVEKFDEKYILTKDWIEKNQYHYRLHNYKGEILYSGATKLEFGKNMIFSLKNNRLFILDTQLKVIHTIADVSDFIHLGNDHVAVKLDSNYHLYNIKRRSFTGLIGNYFHYISKCFIIESNEKIEMYDAGYQFKAVVNIDQLKEKQRANFYSSANYVSKEINWSFDKKSAFEEFVYRNYYQNLVWEKLKSNK